MYGLKCRPQLRGVVSSSVVQLLRWMYMLQISLERFAINEIVTSSNPGGQWLPFRGHYTVPSLSGGCGFKSRDTRKNFHFKFIGRKLFHTNSAFQVDQFSFKSRAVPNFFPSSTCYKSYLYLTYFRYFSHRSWMMYLTIFLLSLPVFLSSVESFETCGKSLNFFLLPSFKYPNSLHGGAA